MFEPKKVSAKGPLGFAQRSLDVVWMNWYSPRGMFQSAPVRVDGRDEQDIAIAELQLEVVSIHSRPGGRERRREVLAV